MSKVDYLVVEKNTDYSGEVSYYCRKTGYISSRQYLLQILGAEGWELVSESYTQMTFRQAQTLGNLIDDFVQGIADERIKLALSSYKATDGALKLFASIAFGGLLPGQDIESHCGYMVSAIYRFYEGKNRSNKIKECYTETLKLMSTGLASPEILEQLNAQTESPLTIVDAADVFFCTAIAQFTFEKKVIAPFVVPDLHDFIDTFTAQIKNNAATRENKKLATVIQEHKNYIQKNFRRKRELTEEEKKRQREREEKARQRLEEEQKRQHEEEQKRREAEKKRQEELQRQREEERKQEEQKQRKVLIAKCLTLPTVLIGIFVYFAVSLFAPDTAATVAIIFASLAVLPWAIVLLKRLSKQ